jgi:transposase-like protein
MEEQKAFSKAEKRWIVREIQTGRMTIGEACERIELYSKDPRGLLYFWQKQFASDIEFTLPVMTEKEKVKLDAAQKRMKELEKQLEHAQMKNIALETMIDIAEEQLKITIRKKSGLKQ